MATKHLSLIQYLKQNQMSIHPMISHTKNRQQVIKHWFTVSQVYLTPNGTLSNIWHFWLRIILSALIFDLWKQIFNQYFEFRPKLLIVLSKILIFIQKFDFWTKTNCWPIFWFSTKAFDFLSEISIFIQKFDFWRKTNF